MLLFIVKLIENYFILNLAFVCIPRPVDLSINQIAPIFFIVEGYKGPAVMLTTWCNQV